MAGSGQYAGLIPTWPVVECNGVRWYVAPRMIGGQPIGDALVKAHSCELPSPDLVRAIEAAADCKLEATRFVRTARSTPPNDYTAKGLQSRAVLVDQAELVDASILAWEAAYRMKARLVVGTHKDVVRADHDYPHLRAGRLGICGWRRLDGTWIQPISSVHALGYFDYSQGVRLCHRV